MSKNKTFIESVLLALEKGSNGLFTQKEIKDYIIKHGGTLNFVHLRGDRGLFEPVQEDKDKSQDEQRIRLNSTGIDILLSHKSIEQAKRQAVWATALAIIAIIISIVFLFASIFLSLIAIFLTLP